MKESIEIEDNQTARVLFGAGDANLRLIRDHLEIKVVARNGRILFEGKEESVHKGVDIVKALVEIIEKEGHLSRAAVIHTIDSILRDEEALTEVVEVFNRSLVIRPKTEGQKKFVQSIRHNDLVFCIGPAGTGKTYLATAIALNYLKKRLVGKIVLARPAIEAGEKLGFLPGDIQAKVHPYLRPIYDALHEMMEYGQLRKYVENDMIEVIPLAYMRGRTLNNAFIILDEAQNCTIGQMKMFLTRFGPTSKVIVNGDISQVDLPSGETSGLIHSQQILRKIEGIEFVYLTRFDIVRHDLVGKIVEAYSRDKS
jgi:phosphate starvation-inducible PhoH-like protein